MTKDITEHLQIKKFNKYTFIFWINKYFVNKEKENSQRQKKNEKLLHDIFREPIFTLILISFTSYPSHIFQNIISKIPSSILKPRTLKFISLKTG